MRHKTEKVGNAHIANSSLGLISMREPAEMMGGTFVIEAQHGNGTTVKAAVPMTNGKTV